MGIVRALVALVLIAVAASPMVSGRLGTGTDVPSVYADVVRDLGPRQERPGQGEEGRRIARATRTRRVIARRPRRRSARRRSRKRGRRLGAQPRPTPSARQLPARRPGRLAELRGPAEGDRDPHGRRRSDALPGAARPGESVDRLYCGDLQVGDYVFVHEAEKRNELAYDAYYISCQQEREEGPDNTNDNEDDVDPNCGHIWSRLRHGAAARAHASTED